MNCFFKHVEHYNDVAVHGYFQRDRFVPFTLLSFSGFNDPPSIQEARFLIDVMLALASDEKMLIVCRNAIPDEGEFYDDADRVLRGFDLDYKPNKRVWLSEPRFYCAGETQRSQLARILHRYWTVWGGNWFLFDWNSDPIAVSEASATLSTKWKRVSAMHGDMLYSRNVSALTFDDILFEVYTKRNIDFALSVAGAAQGTNAIQLAYERGG